MGTSSAGLELNTLERGSFRAGKTYGAATLVFRVCLKSQTGMSVSAG